MLSIQNVCCEILVTGLLGASNLTLNLPGTTQREKQEHLHHLQCLREKANLFRKSRNTFYTETIEKFLPCSHRVNTV